MNEVIFEQSTTFNGEVAVIKVYESINKDLNELATGELLAELFVYEDKSVMYRLESNGEGTERHLHVTEGYLYDEVSVSVNGEDVYGYLEQNRSERIDKIPNAPEEIAKFLARESEQLVSNK